MVIVAALWEAPTDLQRGWRNNFLHDPSDEESHEVAIDLVVETIEDRGFRIERDVYVTVQRKIGETPCVVYSRNGESVIAINEFVFDQLDHETRLDAIAHELCHVEALERFGEHAENDRRFCQLLRKRRAAIVEEDLEV